jgi:glutathione synthase/RimK-type ligase-like ATP-grasp enzyme
MRAFWSSSLGGAAVANLLVVDRLQGWSGRFADAEVVRAHDYLTDPTYTALRGARVFNLCQSYRYQRYGYYVSLLAGARGHRPLPDVATIQDLKGRSAAHLVTDELDAVIQRSLATLRGDTFTLSIYFARNMARRHERLSRLVFQLFPAPLLRAEFVRRRGRWQLQIVRPIPAGEVPQAHEAFLREAVAQYFSRTPRRARPARRNAYEMAVLVNSEERFPPSNERALRRFTRAARAAGFGVERIGRDDFARLAEFDALFIRETTRVNHHTYRFARRAAAEGLVVIDDPVSILRCTNKVYLAELMERKRVPMPRTVVVDRRNAAEVGRALGFPCVLKLPDSAFSQGVVKVDDAASLERELGSMLERTDLVVAQEFMRTDYDWRVGVLGGEALYACRYFMVKRHWQIYKQEGGGRTRSGSYDTLAVEDAPTQVVRLALRAARAVGDGLYGVDIKQRGRHCCVIEVNDNPSLDAEVEDRVLGQRLYERIAAEFFRRVEAVKGRATGD